MKYFLHCLSAEVLKTKRTIALMGVIVLPTILTFFNFLLLVGLSQGERYASERGWVHFEHNTITFWAMLVFSSVVVLVSAFSAHQEHDPRQWRRLMCLPLPKAPLYLAKLTIVMGLALLSCLLLWVENIGWGWLFSLIRPEMGLSIARITLWDMLVPYLWIFVFALLILALHFWFSMRVQNFVLSIGMGFALTLAGAFLHDVTFWKVAFPWALPSLAFTASAWSEVYVGLLYSGVGFVVISLAGCWEFIRRDVLS